MTPKATSRATRTPHKSGLSKTYLEKHGNQWRVQVRVPPKLQSIMGKKRLVVPLHTSSLADANRLKWDVVAKLKAEIALTAKGEVLKTDTLIEEAMRWRETIQTEKPRTATFVSTSGHLIEADEYPVKDGLLPDRALEIEDSHGEEAAETFFKVATGAVTPVQSLVDLWIAEAGIKPRQQRDYRRAVKVFDTWCQGQGHGSIEQVTRKLAGRYISEQMVAKGRHPKTANKDISCLSSYWRWLLKRGHVSENPWQGQSLSKKLAPKSNKRPFTDDEVKRLITETKNQFLLDLMTVAALSGMRREEIMLLRKVDCEGGLFNVRDAKTLAGIRQVPIHSDLKAIVSRRTKDKAAEDWLFDEPSSEGGGVTERGDYAGKKFNAYRKKLGIDERKEGQRQSGVDLHSMRRWFIATATEALRKGAKGYDQWTVAEVVGHDTKATNRDLNMTMGVYAGKQGEKAKRAAVEAVRLPLSLPTA